MLSEFLTYHAQLGHSQHTIRAYNQSLQKFIAEFPEYLTASKAEIRAAVNEVFDNRPATFNVRLAAVKSFYAWLTNEKELFDRSPVEDMRNHKLPKRNIQIPTHISVTRLYREQGGDWFDVRNAAIVALLAATGLRVAELCSLDVADLSGDTLTVIGKGDKERTVFINDTAKKYLRRWTQIRPDVGPLFCTQRGGPLNPRNVAQIIEKRSDGQLTPHSLRHHFCTTLIKKGMPIEQVSLLMGHTSITTTMKYLHLDTNDIRNKYKEIMN